MQFDLTFEEAIGIVKNKAGYVQGENFASDEYLSYDPYSKCFCKNTVNTWLGLIFDTYCNQTREIWNSEKDMDDSMKKQRYRLIINLSKDSVTGNVGSMYNLYDNKFLQGWM